MKAKGIKYVKLMCEGRDETPTPDQVGTFNRICTEFIDKNPNDLIAVHCTHGFNRTGFLICSFLVEVEDWSIEMAIQSFATSRPPGIYKQDYLNELIRRYDEGEPVPMAPQLPDWCYEDEEDDDLPGNGQAEQNGQGDHGRKAAAFMEGVDGVVPVPENERKQLCNLVVHMTNWKAKDPFPGAQPVSMTKKNLDYLNQMKYRVSWKADGTKVHDVDQGSGPDLFL